jgi:hypothetical protein
LHAPQRNAEPPNGRAWAYTAAPQALQYIDPVSSFSPHDGQLPMIEVLCAS